MNSLKKLCSIVLVLAIPVSQAPLAYAGPQEAGRPIEPTLTRFVIAPDGISQLHLTQPEGLSMTEAANPQAAARAVQWAAGKLQKALPGQQIQGMQKGATVLLFAQDGNKVHAAHIPLLGGKANVRAMKQDEMSGVNKFLSEDKPADAYRTLLVAASKNYSFDGNKLRPVASPTYRVPGTPKWNALLSRLAPRLKAGGEAPQADAPKTAKIEAKPRQPDFLSRIFSGVKGKAVSAGEDIRMAGLRDIGMMSSFGAGAVGTLALVSLHNGWLDAGISLGSVALSMVSFGRAAWKVSKAQSLGRRLALATAGVGVGFVVGTIMVPLVFGVASMKAFGPRIGAWLQRRDARRRLLAQGPKVDPKLQQIQDQLEGLLMHPHVNWGVFTITGIGIGAGKVSVYVEKAEQIAVVKAVVDKSCPDASAFVDYKVTPRMAPQSETSPRKATLGEILVYWTSVFLVGAAQSGGLIGGFSLAHSPHIHSFLPIAAALYGPSLVVGAAAFRRVWAAIQWPKRKIGVLEKALAAVPTVLIASIFGSFIIGEMARKRYNAMRAASLKPDVNESLMEKREGGNLNLQSDGNDWPLTDKEQRWGKGLGYAAVGFPLLAFQIGGLLYGHQIHNDLIYFSPLLLLGAANAAYFGRMAWLREKSGGIHRYLMAAMEGFLAFGFGAAFGAGMLAQGIGEARLAPKISAWLHRVNAITPTADELGKGQALGNIVVGFPLAGLWGTGIYQGMLHHSIPLILATELPFMAASTAIMAFEGRRVAGHRSDSVFFTVIYTLMNGVIRGAYWGWFIVGLWASMNGVGLAIARWMHAHSQNKVVRRLDKLWKNSSDKK